MSSICQNFRPPYQLQQLCCQDCLDTPPMDRDSGDMAHDGDVFWDMDTPCKFCQGMLRAFVNDIKGAMITSLLCGILGNYTDRSDDCFPQTILIDHIVKHGTRRYPHGSSRFESHYHKATKFEKQIAPVQVCIVSCLKWNLSKFTKLLRFKVPRHFSTRWPYRSLDFRLLIYQLCCWYCWYVLPTPA